MSAGIARAVPGPYDTLAGQGEPLQRNLCGVCGTPLAGKQREWCSDACRWKGWDAAHPRQKALDFTPPPEPLPPVADQRPTSVECEKLRGDNALVLARLRLGPATTLELQAAAPRSMAVHSRVSDVRKHLEPLGETVKRTCIGPRLHRYQIEGAVGEWKPLQQST